jgi:ABC-type amino acid transport substrate-binding protein
MRNKIFSATVMMFLPFFAAANSRSPKSFAVVSNSRDVKNVSDLRGRRVAGLRGSVVHQVFNDVNLSSLF